jgi:hypothetical protein
MIHDHMQRHTLELFRTMVLSRYAILGPRMTATVEPVEHLVVAGLVYSSQLALDCRRALREGSGALVGLRNGLCMYIYVYT